MFFYGSVLAASNYSRLYKGLYFVLTDKSEARGKGDNWNDPFDTSVGVKG